jgi:serine phosphatase RsbU (regulator of sigma subunit)
MLIIVTDGITEAEDPKQNFYGLARVLAYFATVNGRPLSAAAACAGLLADVKSFTAGAASDDITVMAIRLAALPPTAPPV